MSVTTKARTALINHRCDECERWAIKPGHRYMTHTIFPSHDVLGKDQPYGLKQCISCAVQRDEAADLTYKACGAYCCGLHPCAQPVHHGGDHSCREDVLAAGNWHSGITTPKTLPYGDGPS